MRQDSEGFTAFEAAGHQLRAVLGEAAERGFEALERTPVSIAAMRALEEGVTRLFGFGALPVAERRDLRIGSGPAAVPCRLYRGQGAPSPAPLIVYFHGGGFIAGSLDSHDGVARALANAARAVVLSVGYRLAPEHPYPAALEDGLAAVLKAWRRAAHLDCDARKLFLAGDSAGGTIATVLARLLAEEGRVPAGQVLFYPATDLRRSRFARGRWHGLHGVERRALDLFRKLVLGHEGDLGDPLLSPLCAPSLEGMPPAHIAVGGRDPLHAEIADYVAALRGAGTRVEDRSYPSQPHGFLGFARIMKDAGPALAAAGKWVQDIAGDRS